MKLNQIHLDKVQRFYNLHTGKEILVLPNAWDAATARVFEQAGFPAIGTTSAGIAASLGFSEPERTPRAEMLAAVARIVRSVSIPVSADMEAGYADTPAGVGETVKLVIEAGAAGINLEDTQDSQESPLRTISDQIQRLKAARRVADTFNMPFIINARTDLYLFSLGSEQDRFEEVVKRSNCYLEAGADCVFIPGVSDADLIARLVQRIKGPINILANPNVPKIQELKKLGIKRVSTGSGPARATLGLVRSAAQELKEFGTYNSFTQNSIPYKDVNAFFHATYDHVHEKGK
jgi:2-methylisocitrate lyase-like PEP mutase family enzyme